MRDTMLEDCIFSGFPLDPADHMRGDRPALLAKLGDPSSHFLVYDGGRPLMDVADGLHPAFRFADEVAAICGKDAQDTDWVFLGRDGGDAFFAVSAGAGAPRAATEKFIDLRSVALQLGGDEFSAMPALLARGKMLLDWNRRRHFCSCCGTKTVSRRGGYIRRCGDAACGAEHFPRTDPVVIMFVTRGDKCLLGRGPGWPEGNYSALAGFMEPGETIEEAVRREVLEEAGVKVGAVRYVKSQPWPFPSSLMIGVQAEALTTEITLDDELEDAAWFDRAYLRGVMARGGDDRFRIPPAIAIARHLLEGWLAED